MHVFYEKLVDEKFYKTILISKFYCSLFTRQVQLEKDWMHINY